MSPEVSVIMNCYNGERFLRQAIDSVYAQTFENWEIIFWDNASSDGTAEIANSYDERLRYFCSAKTAPLGAARKLAMTKASGTWIGFLDSDDLWYPKKLETQLNALGGSEHILCYAGINEIHPGGSLIRTVLPRYKSGYMLEQQLLQFEINMVTPLLKREALNQFNLSFDGKITASEEYNLFIRMMAKGSVCTIPEVLGAWRISTGSLTDKQISKWADERRYTLFQIKKENAGIEAKYPNGFREAAARAEYYRARYLMTEGRKKEAKQVMAKIAPSDIKYRVLWLGMSLPYFWRFVHGTYLKRKILPRLLKVSNQIE